LNLLTTPQELEVLLTSKESSAIKFRDQIRMYNSVLAFTLLGAKVDESVTGGPGPYAFAFKVNFITKSDPYVLLKDNGHNLHNYTFMKQNVNIKTAMPLLSQPHFGQVWG